MFPFVYDVYIYTVFVKNSIATPTYGGFQKHIAAFVCSRSARYAEVKCEIIVIRNQYRSRFDSYINEHNSYVYFYYYYARRYYIIYPYDIIIGRSFIMTILRSAIRARETYYIDTPKRPLIFFEYFFFYYFSYNIINNIRHL